VTGRDVETATITPLYNPREQDWSQHFIWSANGTRMIGTSQIGRATCDRLDLNDDRYKGDHPITEARALWIKAGWHPPSDDPRAED
jgi:hypothetical protein